MCSGNYIEFEHSIQGYFPQKIFYLGRSRMIGADHCDIQFQQSTVISNNFA